MVVFGSLALTLVVGGLITAALVFLIVKRLNDKEKEDFEQRDN